MAVKVYIDGDDRTNYIQKDSLQYTQVLTQQVDTANFSIKYYGSKTYIPYVGNEVKIIDNGTTVFAGSINTIDTKVEAYGIRIYECNCVDYSKWLDHRLVIDTYTDYTVEDIIKDIVDNYCEHFTYSNVSCDVEIGYIAFNYEQPSQCIKQLAEMVNYDWYIDENRDIHFFNKETNPAPYEITDTGRHHIKDSVKIRSDVSKLRNTIIVRGGEYLADTITVNIRADGQRRWYETNYKMNDVRVFLSGQERTVGIDYIDDENSYDVLYNFNEKTVKWKEVDKPRDTMSVEIVGRPYLPVIVKYKDQDAIDTTSALESSSTADYQSTGIYEHKIIDKSIKTKEGARDRARAELYAYAETLSEGEFATEDAGFRTGQQVRINITNLNVDEYFIINRVQGRMWTNDKMVYQVSLVTTKTIGFIDFLQKLLTQKDKEIEIKENEIQDEIESVFETINITESISQATATDLSDTINIDESIATSLTTANSRWGCGGADYNQWCLAQWM